MTCGDQRDDFMMRDICANDLGLEMAHLSQSGSSVHTKDRLRALCGHCALVVFKIGLFHTSSCLMPEASSQSNGSGYRTIHLSSAR